MAHYTESDFTARGELELPMRSTRGLFVVINQLGIVSNCWKHQLDEGVSLANCLDQATKYGLVAIELRQTALGDLESTDRYFPSVERLKEVTDSYPDLCFDYAMGLSFLSGAITREADLVEQACQAAVAVSGAARPHLRLVDLATTAAAMGEHEENVVRELVGLVREMNELGGLLSVENCRQPWSDLWRIVQRSRDQLGALGDQLKICFDPANFGFSTESGNSLEALSQLKNDDLSMVHLKQIKEGVVLRELVAGEVDWRVHLEQLQQISYQGPCLFEMAPGPDCWLQLDAAKSFFQQQRS